MGSSIAAIRGTTSLYTYVSGHKVLLMRDGYDYIVVRDDTFHDMYNILSIEKAALKEDCIEYVIHYPDKPIFEYPQWYINAYSTNDIFDDDYGGFLFWEPTGEIPMAPGSIILRNKHGALMYMERNKFESYYETPGGLEDEF